MSAKVVRAKMVGSVLTESTASHVIALLAMKVTVVRNVSRFTVNAMNLLSMENSSWWIKASSDRYKIGTVLFN